MLTQRRPAPPLPLGSCIPKDADNKQEMDKLGGYVPTMVLSALQEVNWIVTCRVRRGREIGQALWNSWWGAGGGDLRTAACIQGGGEEQVRQGREEQVKTAISWERRDGARTR